MDNVDIKVQFHTIPLLQINKNQVGKIGPSCRTRGLYEQQTKKHQDAMRCKNS